MKDLESHVKDEYEFGMVYGGEMVYCGVASWAENSGHLIFRSEEGFWWQHREMDYFLPRDECQRMKCFVWRRERIGAFWRETERRK